jgi:DDE superfamily endonuclease
MSLHPILRKCWMKRGQRKLIPAPGQLHWEHLFGAYNWRTDCVSWQFAPSKNSTSFIAFIEHLMTVCYPIQKVILVTDNASYHKSRALLAALSLFEDRLTVNWLPHRGTEPNVRFCAPEGSHPTIHFSTQSSASGVISKISPVPTNCFLALMLWPRACAWLSFSRTFAITLTVSFF